jgi:lysozyme
MEASNKVIAKIKEWEGFRGKAYKDASGVWTIGFGHTKDVKAGMLCTERVAGVLLRTDVRVCEKELNALALELTQNQFDALISFTFNIGTTKFRKSTLLKRIREGARVAVVQNELRRWVHDSKGDRLPGLVARREWEAQLWAEGLAEG